MAGICNWVVRDISDELYIEFSHRSIPIYVDVSDFQSAQGMVSLALDQIGQADVLVNNARIVGSSFPVVDNPIEMWSSELAVDLDGLFYCTKSVLPQML
jgi:NAD(P)-dependent dehydrogenase (short-subunit alcohol dehydrogenase family)